MDARNTEAAVQVASPPLQKRAKVEPPLEKFDSLLRPDPKELISRPSLPPSLLASGQTRNDLTKLKVLFHEHGFRTSVVSSPREALSIYKDSCVIDNDDASHNNASNTSSSSTNAPGRLFLISMLGLHPDQTIIEQNYLVSIRDIYCLRLFCQKVRAVCGNALKDEDVKKFVATIEKECCFGFKPISTVSERAAALMETVVKADSRLRQNQLQREYDRILTLNSTYSNALVQLFVEAHHCSIKDALFKRSHVAKYERLTLYLYDPNVDTMKPPKFTFIPALRKAIDDGAEAVAEDMVESFWSRMLRCGYFATPCIKAAMSPDLQKYFLSGLARDPSLPLLLNAHFDPTYPLSFYSHGLAGAGKSSLVRSFAPALNGVIEDYCDPEILVRFVKQNLNKPQKHLSLEMELRPNNNDLSVMSIIQGRRMTQAQSKPGLVVVGMEELAADEASADPNQADTCRLISQRFSGRKGEFTEGETCSARPKNSTKRGISGDASLIVLFTSNYELGETGDEALKRLEMFKNLRMVETQAISGEDRLAFALAYLKQCISDRFGHLCVRSEVRLNTPIGSGDTRPLVQNLRMIAFFIFSSLSDNIAAKSTIDVSITEDPSTCLLKITANGNMLEYRKGANGILLHSASGSNETDSFTKKIAEILPQTESIAELRQVIDLYSGQALSPAVVVSNNSQIIHMVFAAIAAEVGVHSFSGIDPTQYKMMKSLYDPTDTPNLRDDILKLGKGARTVVELKCSSRDAQLLIREMIEDTPSLTAFSTTKSALYKDGLFFCVYVEGEITPEIRSRATLIL